MLTQKHKRIIAIVLIALGSLYLAMLAAHKYWRDDLPGVSHVYNALPDGQYKDHVIIAFSLLMMVGGSGALWMFQNKKVKFAQVADPIDLGKRFPPGVLITAGQMPREIQHWVDFTNENNKTIKNLNKLRESRNAKPLLEELPAYGANPQTWGETYMKQRKILRQNSCIQNGQPKNCFEELLQN